MTTEFIVSPRTANRGSANPAARRSSANSSNVNVPPDSVFTSMLTANSAPSRGLVRHGIHHNVPDRDPPLRLPMP